MRDEDYMRMALSYARRGIGEAWPNPSVGCVIVKNGKIIARGRTHKGGRPHAEAEALERAGKAAQGATAYVTLEPCAIHGRDEPCAGKLIAAKVARVVIACIDPNPNVNGKGIKALKAAGIEVTYGVLENEASRMNMGFFLTHLEDRPWVTLKLAVSSDGMIAAEKGTRTQITGEMATRYMHNLRSRHDAIMVGSETALVDNPNLTARIHGYEHVIKRYVLDRNKRVKPRDGFEIINEYKSLRDILKVISSNKTTRLLVEGGAKLHQSFLESGLVDSFELCRSPLILGEKGVSASYIEKLEEFGLKLGEVRTLGEDTLEIYNRAE